MASTATMATDLRDIIPNCEDHNILQTLTRSAFVSSILMCIRYCNLLAISQAFTIGCVLARDFISFLKSLQKLGEF